MADTAQADAAGLLRERLRQLEEQIAETRRRLPAHSVKPPLMMDLLALEDELDLLLRQLEAGRDGG